MLAENILVFQAYVFVMFLRFCLMDMLIQFYKLSDRILSTNFSSIKLDIWLINYINKT